ncbi:transcriptional regulator [Aliidongia dinghuensis]|uniref:Transcriptional regulator n=1 Tax=Aliidongia dinghuensis TaxID=1867774 RepID=A0A8J2YQT3_9PROT|nr:MerR family transcriptional regulator [Aliidongia dinghuensis]GGF09711.1 transcriptional regulator [Aliidongia dinghuensis]
MKIGDLARRTGLSTYTIRYYERIGLLPRVPRTSSQRDYDVSILPWVEFIGRLKTTAMPIREMVRYAQLRARGPETNAERRELLERHRDQVRAHVAELQACLAVLDDKIAGYADDDRMEQSHDADALRDQRPVRAGAARPR